jgi:hypothetical protein
MVTNRKYHAGHAMQENQVNRAEKRDVCDGCVVGVHCRVMGWHENPSGSPSLIWRLGLGVKKNA